MKKIAFLILISLSLSSFANKGTVVATVDGVKIYKSELDEYYKKYLLTPQKKKVSRRDALNDLINRIIGIQQAKKDGLQNDPEVKNKMEDVLYHAKISKDLEGKLNEIKVSDSEVKEYYKTHKEYRTSHILFRLRATPSKEDVAKAYEAALKTYQMAKEDPELFTNMANVISQTSVAPVGGDLGFQPPTRYAPEFFEAIQGKEIGHITQPVRTQYGFHIIKILGVKEFKNIDMNVYKKIVYDIKRDKILEDYFKKQRAKAKVIIKAKKLK